MKSAREPVRVTDAGSSASPELSAAVHALRALHGSAEQIDALGRSLAPQLAAPTFAGSVANGLRAGSKWLLAGLVAVGVGLGATAMLERAEEPAPAVAAPQPPVARAAPRLREASAPSDRARVSDEPIVEAESAAAVPAARPRRSRTADRRPPPPTQAQALAPRPELALLEEAHALLERDPAAAMLLVEEHERAYPAGVFTQERELLAVEALLELDRKQPAIERAQRFVKSYGDSPHAPRVRALLRRSRPLDTAGTGPSPHLLQRQRN
jgi:hypothetical protein